VLLAVDNGDEWWEEDNRPGRLRVFDPESDRAELDVPVASSEVRARWMTGELWFSEGQGFGCFG
jgi:streptogramin lyase